MVEVLLSKDSVSTQFIEFFSSITGAAHSHAYPWPPVRYSLGSVYLGPPLSAE